jgi:geranylgeranyl reductase family protein
MYDAAVVGAGPAGATLAALLAGQGARTVVLEACRLPRYKPCGGGLTLRAVRLLPPDLLGAVRLRCATARAVRGRREVLVQGTPWAVAMVMRDEFDLSLVRRARDAGAEVREGCAVGGVRLLPEGVELIAGGEAVRAHFLACADGATGPFAGPLGRAVGLAGTAPRIGALEVEVEDPGGAWGDEVRGDFDLVPRGYGWVFPKAGVLSVGVASWQQGVGGRALRVALDRYRERLGLGARRVLRAHGHPIPVGGRLPAASLASRRALRLGDAAGLADPLFGEGIAYALESAHLAAAAVLRGEPEAYAAAVARRLYHSFRWAEGIARAFYARPETWFAVAAALPPARALAWRAALGGLGVAAPV